MKDRRCAAPTMRRVLAIVRMLAPFSCIFLKIGANCSYRGTFSIATSTGWGSGYCPEPRRKGQDHPWRGTAARTRSGLNVAIQRAPLLRPGIGSWRILIGPVSVRMASAATGISWFRVSRSVDK